MNVIDKLVVTLGLDNTLFKKGIKESDKIQEQHADKTKKIDKQSHEAERKVERNKDKFHKDDLRRNKESLEGFTKLRNETIAFLLIFTAGKGLLSFFADTITNAAALGRLAETADMGVGKLGGWGLALENVGGHAEEASAAIRKATTDVADYNQGIQNSTIENFVTAAGIAHVSWNVDTFKNAESFLLAKADVLKALVKTRGSGVALDWAEKIGAGGSMFDLLKQGSGSVQQQVSDSARVVGMTEEKAKAAQRLERQWNNVEASLKRVGEALVIALGPSVLDVIQHLTTFVSKKENIDSLTKEIKEFSTELKNIDWKSVEIGVDDAFKGVGWFFKGLGNAVKLMEFGADWIGGKQAEMASQHNIESQQDFWKQSRPGGAYYNQQKSMTIAFGDINLTVPAGTRDPHAFVQIVSDGVKESLKTTGVKESLRTINADSATN